MVSESRIADLEKVPDDSTLLFTVCEAFDEKEVLLVHLNGEVAAWRNCCPNWIVEMYNTAAL
jgi:nitrite reductase/ring-hydroxylating ferredoxin subunit